MHAVEALISGIAGAANGHAELYVRGTSTRATWYSDFEGEQAFSSGDDIDLDANGSAVVYVNQLVNVIVKDSDGATVREFVAGSAAGNVEVRSLSFTGVDYESGQSDEGNPTNLAAVLDLWRESAGTSDWLVVAPDGTVVTIQEALGSVVGIFYNVKTYGAEGDNSTDDLVAIEDTIAAAVAAGGGNVFFPEGTYRVTAAFTWPATVNLVGAGYGISVITIDHATENLIEVTAVGRRSMVELGLQASQTNTGNLLNISSASGITLRVQRCALGSTASTGDLVQVDGNAEHFIFFEDSRCLIAGATHSAIDATDDSQRIFVRGCHFFQNQGTYTGSLVKVAGHLTLTGSDFEFTGHTSGTLNAVEISAAGGSLSMAGNRMHYGDSPGGTQRGVRWASGARINIAGNALLPQSSTHVRYSAAGVAGQGSLIADLDYADATLSGTTTTLPDGFGVYVLNSTNTTEPAITMPTKLFPGQKMTLLIRNSSVGNWGGPYSFVGLSTTSNVYAVAIANLTNGANGLGIEHFLVADPENSGTYAWMRLTT